MTGNALVKKHYQSANLGYNSLNRVKIGEPFIEICPQRKNYFVLGRK